MSAYRKSGQQYFSIVHIANFLGNSSSDTVVSGGYVFPVGSSLKVNDFRILDNKVFFCGQWGTNQAAYGWFNLCAGILPTNSCTVYHTTEAKELRRLVVYNNGSYHLAAVGEDKYRHDIIFEAYDVLGIGVDFSFVALPYINTSRKEFADDLALVDDHVVVVGRDTRNGIDNDAIVRVGDSPSVVIPNTINKRYRIPLSGIDTCEPARITHLQEGGKAAIAYMGLGTEVPAAAFYHKLDISYAAVPSVLYTNRIDLHREDTLKEMTYTFEDRALMLFNRQNSVAFFAHALLSPTAPYLTDAPCFSSKIFRSLDRLGDNAFVAWGNYAVGLKKWLTPSTPLFNPCIGYLQLQVINMTTPTLVETTEIATKTSGTCVMSTVNNPQSVQLVNKLCSEPY